MTDIITRCDWRTSDPVLIHYHDTEWGVPVHDDHLLFEYLAPDCFQAGLSWLTVSGTARFKFYIISLMHARPYHYS